MASLGYVKDTKNSRSCPFLIGPRFAFFQFSTHVHVKREILEPIIIIIVEAGDMPKRNDMICSFSSPMHSMSDFHKHSTPSFWVILGYFGKGVFLPMGSRQGNQLT